MSKEAFYFSHDSNARNDEKILAVRMRHGAEGYGVYFMILERLLESTKYMSVKDYNVIAFDLRVSASVIKSVIEDFGLFVFTDEGKHFYSESLIRRMQPLDNLREQRRAAGKKSAEKRALKSVENQGIGTTVERPLNEKPTKESKVKESKGNILLEKESKGVREENPSQDLKNQEIEEKEKSSAKKEKEIESLRSSDFFKQLCVYFSQTNEVLEMRAFGDLCRLHDTGQLQNFIKQTKAYMAYKQLTGEKVHRFQNFIYEWKNEDWVNKLKNQQNQYGKPVNNSSSGKGYKPAYADTDKLVRELESDFENGNIPGVY
ncbi:MULTISPECIES: Lin1244/Lin1753 domain-containing protein [unclassified Myroides]|uniref:Lin1244/Lin1753 domain-containing protein n=1 Tax=unclassified Myroides TaxID=2642485 RepID=UPI003D2F8BE2